MNYTYRPKGTCSTEMRFDIEDGIVRDMEVIRGCDGNLKGIRSLCRGMKVDEVIERLDGIRCGFKSTSCPDQIAQALKKYRAEH